MRWVPWSGNCLPMSAPDSTVSCPETAGEPLMVLVTIAAVGSGSRAGGGKTGAPQLPQKLEPVGSSVPQSGHFMVLYLRARLPGAAPGISLESRQPPTMLRACVEPMASCANLGLGASEHRRRSLDLKQELLAPGTRRVILATTMLTREGYRLLCEVYHTWIGMSSGLWIRDGWKGVSMLPVFERGDVVWAA